MASGYEDEWNPFRNWTYQVGGTAGFEWPAGEIFGKENDLSTYGTYASDETNLKDTYIVWSPSASQPPRKVYPDRPTAIKVAHMMAAKNRGQQFAVCKIVGTAKPVDVKFESFED